MVSSVGYAPLIEQVYPPISIYPPIFISSTSTLDEAEASEDLLRLLEG